MNDAKQLVLVYGLFCLYNLMQVKNILDQVVVYAGGATDAGDKVYSTAAIAYAAGLYYLYTSVSAANQLMYFLAVHFAVYFLLLGGSDSGLSALTFQVAKAES